MCSLDYIIPVMKMTTHMLQNNTAVSLQHARPAGTVSGMPVKCWQRIVLRSSINIKIDFIQQTILSLLISEHGNITE